MALTETIEYDKIEVVGLYKSVQVRKATVIKKDGTEMARTFHRYVLNSNADISAEPTEVQAICNAAWTTDVKAAYLAFLDANKPE
tara:strand:+ start:625 stop:879 length:255 start_codon:yes stop_codon:yes gene_type:complete